MIILKFNVSILLLLICAPWNVHSLYYHRKHNRLEIGMTMVKNTTAKAFGACM